MYPFSHAAISSSFRYTWWWVGSRYGERSSRWRSLMGTGSAAVGMRRVADMIGNRCPLPEPHDVAKAPATAPLTRKAEAALRDRRPGEALALARQFADLKPGPEAQSLLQRCFLAAVEVHVERGSFRDAHLTLSEAEGLPSTDAAWWERLAELRADLGDHSRALELLDNAPDSTARPRVLGRVVDRALRDEAAGRPLLPADLQPQFDLVCRAFAEYETGRDDSARETLNGIGLTSPFLDWKLLLRGLIAWSANDTPRALENWSRLSPDRLPARMAAPFR